MGKVKAGEHVFQVLKHELCSRKLPPNAVVFLTAEQAAIAAANLRLSKHVNEFLPEICNGYTSG